MFTKHDESDIKVLLKKKARRKAVPGGPSKPLTLIINILHQGFFYLDTTERLMRVCWEIIPFIILYAIVPPSNIGSFSFIVHVVLLIGFVHVLNWIFNHNFWNCINSTFPNMKNRGVKETSDYIRAVAARLKKQSSISAIMLLGSISRARWNDRSDIDMRILRKQGIWNGIKASLLVSRERLIAVFVRQPLDVYLADTPAFLKKRRADEPPIFILKRDVRLDNASFPLPELKYFNISDS